jgi:hypothetical protein
VLPALSQEPKQKIADNRVVIRGVYDYSSRETPPLKKILGAEQKVHVRITHGLDSRLLKTKVPTAWIDSSEKLSETLLAGKNLIVLTSARVGEENTWHVEILMRDVQKGGQKNAIEAMKKSLEKSTDSRWFLAISQSEGQVPAVIGLMDPKALDREMEANLKGTDISRYLAFQNTAIVTVAPKNAKETRKMLIGSYVESMELSVKDLRRASNERVAGSVSRIIVEATNDLFGRLANGQVFDDKTSAYDLVWRNQLRASLAAHPRDATTILSLQQFLDEFSASVRGDKCTVTVCSSKGNGASVRYAKLPDARRNIFKEMPALTVTSAEVEPAKYVFQSFRAMKKTGETESIECTGETACVTIPEE